VSDDILALAVDLRRCGEAFALATVVRCERPTSAKPGAKALIRPDGRVEGWIGGACAEPVVVREALNALRDGEPRFISLIGQAGHGRGAAEGVIEHAMACHSGGTLEIYVEPVLPKPLLVVIGQGPVVDTLAALGRATQFEVAVIGSEPARSDLERLALTPRASVVVAGHGNFDEEALAQVLSSDARYVSLVASRKRAAAVVESLQRRGLSAQRVGRLIAPAGLDLGAVTPAEIAVSILAEIIQARRSVKSPAEPIPDTSEARLAQPAGDASGATRVMTEARDPVCGMLVEVATARCRSEAGGRPVYFCCLSCKETFDAEPQRYEAALDHPR
jgi:xanthine dehydrogenase accessory factor